MYYILVSFHFIVANVLSWFLNSKEPIDVPYQSIDVALFLI